VRRSATAWRVAGRVVQGARGDEVGVEMGLIEAARKCIIANLGVGSGFRAALAAAGVAQAGGAGGVGIGNLQRAGGLQKKIARGVPCGGAKKDPRGEPAGGGGGGGGVGWLGVSSVHCVAQDGLAIAMAGGPKG
jgi:hypothetical protein